MRQLAKILFTKEDLARANAFATSGAGLRIRGERSNVRMGKLGEIAFARFLIGHGKALWTINNQYLTMDNVYDLTRLDLQTSDGKTVDVKTSKRSNMLVPGNSQKDYYIGVQISPDETQSTIRGFVGFKGLRGSTYAVPGGYQKKFESLVSINKLLEMMPPLAQLEGD